jgi:general secretion pathway protein D
MAVLALGIAVSSSDPAAAQTPTDAGAPAPVRTSRPARSGNIPGPKSPALVTVNFVNADIEAVTRAMAAMLERQIIVDPRVKGNITVYSEQPLTVREAYLNYLAALRGLGFAMVESAGFLKLVPEAEAKLQAGTVSVDGVTKRGDQVLTQIFTLTHENPNNLVAILRPLISPNNTINANPGNNTLVITDYADNLQRIGRIIAALDQPARTEVEVIALKYAVASDMAAVVQRMGDAGSAVPGGPGGVGAAGGLSVLAEPRSNSLIVRAGSAVRLAAVKSLIEKLDMPSQGGPAGMINVVYLKNADATKLATVLRAAFGGGGGAGAGATSPTVPGAPAPGGPAATAATTPVAQSAQPSTGGFIQADPATNSLIITAAEPLYRQIRSVIDQLDSRRALVFVESMIVEMSAKKAAEFGFQWQGLLGKSGDQTGLIGGTNFGTGGNNIINLSVAGATGGLSTTAPGAGLNVGLIRNFNGVYTLASLARFLETVDGTNILSTPNLISLDNEEAKIVVGRNVPFVTGSFTNTGAATATVNPFQTIERKDVGLTLRVKPQIGEGGSVRMTVFQESSSIDTLTATSTNGPTTNKNSIETTVVAEDGQIIVLGGQMKDQFGDNSNRVPGLGDIPILGNLFKNESRNREKTMLLVFLRPVVIRDARAAESLTLDRYESIRAEQRNAQPTPSFLVPINEAPMLPPFSATPGAAAASAPARSASEPRP